MAATSVLKLVVDDKEYSASLKNAKQGMQDLQQSLQAAGKSFTDCDKAVVDYAKGLGQMEATSKTAKGQINEMSSAFVELSRVYQQMTQQEKQSPVGQALSQSLEQLKQRTIDAKNELANISNQLEPVKEKTSETGGVFGKLADRLTVNIDAMKMFDFGLKAVGGALNVVKDYLSASEAKVDEWGRTMQAGRSLYEGFLNALNTGDIGGYLSRIDDIVKAARKAYDELDRLGTMKTIQAPQMSAQQTRNDRLRSMLMTGTYMEPIGGSYETVGNLIGLKTGDRLDAVQIRAIEKALQKGVTRTVDLIQNEIDQSGKAIDAFYTSFATDLGMSLQEFRRGTSSMEEFDRRINAYKEYVKFEADHTERVKVESEYLGAGYTIKNVRDNAVNPYAQYKEWGVFRDSGERFQQLIQLIQQRDQQVSQAYSNMTQANRVINRAEGFTVRSITGGGSGGSGGGGSSTQKLSAVEQAAADVAVAEKEYAEAISNAQQKLVENMMKSDEYDKQVLSGQQKLADAYLKAYNATGDETYLNSFRETAQHVNDMQEAVNRNTETQKAAEHAARELAEAEKRLAAEEERQAELRASWQTVNNTGIANYISQQQKGLSTQAYGSQEYNTIAANLADATAFKNLMQVAVQNGLNEIIIDSTPIWKQITEGANIMDADMQTIVNRINEELKKIGKDPIKLDFQTGTTSQARGGDMKEVTQLLSQMTSGVSSITGGLQQLGVEIPEGLSKTIGAIQAIGGILTGITAILTLISTKQTAEMVTSLIPGFAMGGIIHAAGGFVVPGNDHADRTLIAASSGEMVLNEFQQQALAGTLQGAGTLHVTGVLKGEDMLISIDRTARRQGKGELVFWRN